MNRVSRFPLFAFAVWTVWCGILPAAEPQTGSKPPTDTSATKITWHTDYAKATEVARAEGKMLFIFFHQPGEDTLRDYFESKVLTEPTVGKRLQDYVSVKVPLDAKIRVQGKEVAVLKHAAFQQMHRRQGVAILDFAHQDAEYYGHVVSAFPFTQEHCYSARQTSVILDLPPGTADQRLRSYCDCVGRDKSAGGGESSTAEQRQPKPQLPPPETTWQTDYAAATDAAKRQGKMLFVYFCNPGQGEPCNRFKAETLDDPVVRKKLQDYVCVQLPLDTKILVQGEEVPLLTHGAFVEMLGKPGVAIVDFVHKDAKQYGRVVSTFPITGSLWYTPKQMAVILDLPPGTLTQRTLIYAVRTHPERPASTDGTVDIHLLDEAESHSQYQARIRLQGHHNWESRFHHINARLPAGLSSREVCAESWPGENLVEAAIECVRCWRFSSGHWSAVRARHRFFGYDMKRGPNGVWYATGIFGGGR